ncbi:hypothetical protein [Chelatococcus sambhunathii]|uniref:hypothetical protein n=1 Tax=Chelatococcus sambhunathii TaxID=363953 RepID=UPI00285289EB|nr:hypothetical protein [Chelatococcus sambhunathii]
MQRLLDLFLFGMAATGAAAAEPVGREFRVNTFTDGDQRGPSVVALDSGFVVTWYSDGQDGSGYGVYGQRYDHDGKRVGSEFKINTHTRGHQQNRTVEALKNGGFVVAWESSGQDGSKGGVYTQRYRASGKKAGRETRVNSHTGGDQREPDVAALIGGGHVVVWHSQKQDGSGYGVFGQRFDSGGGKAAGEFQINTETNDDQEFPSVAPLPGGKFVVAWSSRGQDGSDSGIYGQRFNRAGDRIGPEFLINSTVEEYQGFPAVTALKGGAFVVTWSSWLQDGSEFGIYGQRFQADGQKLGEEFSVNSTTHLEQIYSSNAALEDGGFVSVWQSFEQDGSENGIFGQRFDHRGKKTGEEFLVNAHTNLAQEFASVTGLPGGGFVVVWRSTDQDGSGTGIFGQRFAP